MFPPHLNLSANTILQTCPDVCFLGDSKSSQVDHRRQPSHLRWLSCERRVVFTALFTSLHPMSFVRGRLLTVFPVQCHSPLCDRNQPLEPEDLLSKPVSPSHRNQPSGLSPHSPPYPPPGPGGAVPASSPRRSPTPKKLLPTSPTQCQHAVFASPLSPWARNPSQHQGKACHTTTAFRREEWMDLLRPLRRLPEGHPL